jgi:CBS domain-containing protein
MMMSEISQRLPVRTRRTEGAHRQTTDYTVLCPLLNRSTLAENCRACARCGQVRLDDPHGAHVVCRAARAEEPLPPRAGQHLPLESAIALLLEHTKVSEVMSHDVLCADADLGAKQLADLLLRRRFGGVPVVDRDGRPLGIASKTDLLREAAETYAWHPPSGPVSDVMTQNAFGLPETASLAHAAALMAYERVHRVPILADDGTVVGIVTPLDLARWLAAKAGYVMPNPPGH